MSGKKRRTTTATPAPPPVSSLPPPTTPQSQPILTPPPAPPSLSVVNGAEVFDKYVVDKIASGFYVDATNISLELGNRLSLNRFDEFHSIKSLNKKVDVAIESFFQSRSVRNFSELERFVTNFVGRWKQQPNIKSFEELGLGSFLRCPKVMSLFKFPASVSRGVLVELQAADIVQPLINFLRKERIHDYDRIVDTQMSAVLLEKVPAPKVLATIFDFKEFFFACRPLVYAPPTELKSEVAKLQKNYRESQIEAMIASYDALTPEGSAHSSILIAECATIMNREPMFLAAKSHVAVMTPYLQASEDLKAAALQIRVNPQTSMVQTSTSAASNIGLGEVSLRADLHVTFANQNWETLFINTLACLMYVLPSVANDLNEGDARTVGSLLQDELRLNYSADIPQSIQLGLRKVFRAVLSAIPNAAELVVENGLFTRAYNWRVTQLRDAAKKVLFGSQSASSVNPKLVEPLLAAAIIWFRMSVVEPLVGNVAYIDPIRLCQSMIPKAIEDASDGITPQHSFLATLRLLERRVCDDLNAPCFEVFGEGSFSAMLCKYPAITDAPFDVLMASMRKQVEAEGGAGQPTTGVERMCVPPTDEEMYQWEIALGNVLDNVLIDVKITLSQRKLSIASVLMAVIDGMKSSAEGFAEKTGSEGLAMLVQLLNESEDLQHRFDSLMAPFQVGEASSGQHESENNAEPTIAGITQLNLIEFVPILSDAVKVACCILENKDRLRKLLGDTHSDLGVDQMLEWYLRNHWQLPGCIAREAVMRAFQDHPTVYRDHSKVLELCAHMVTALMDVESDAILQQSDGTDQPVLTGLSELPCVEWKPDIVKDAIAALKAVPVGVAIGQYVMWKEYFSREVAVDGSEISLIRFITAHAQILHEEAVGAMFMATSMTPAHAEFIKMPQVLPLGRELLTLFQEQYYSRLASCCISALWVDEECARGNTFRANARACILELFESRGVSALPTLVNDIALISLHVPDGVNDGRVLQQLVQFLSDVSRVPVRVVHKLMLDKAQSQQNLLRHLVSLGHRFPQRFSTVNLVWSDYFSRMCATSISIAPAVANTVPHEAPSSVETTPEVSVREASVIDVVSDIALEDVDDCESKKSVIVRLLQREFRYDELGQRPTKEPPEGRKLRNSLELLSASLYSSDVHFVMELVQNADDNAYARETDGVPTLKLQLFPHALVIYNNETGFSEANVVAVCGVGGSTKMGHTGYIGQKGIGFKSVFSISDRPEIHSNGFHIMFDKQISMIEPIWLPDAESSRSLGRWPTKRDPIDDTYYETCLRLVLNEHARKHFAKLTSDMEEVFDGKLILFLNKLSRMVFENKCTSTMIDHLRRRVNDDWTWIQSTYCQRELAALSRTTIAETYWWTMRSVVDEPIIQRNGVGVKQTELVLAFRLCPMTREDGGRTLKLDFSQGLLPIYAFLPTINPVFHFIVQADFVLATSREAILDGNDWNHMLLDEVPALFIAALTEMATWMQLCAAGAFVRAGEECPHIHAITAENVTIEISPLDILSLIPRFTPIQQIGKSLHQTIERIHAGVRNVAFLLNTSGELCKPGDLLSTKSLHVDPGRYVSSVFVREALQKTFLSAEHEDAMDDKSMVALGIEALGTTHIVLYMRLLAERYAAQGMSHAEYLQELAGAMLLLATIMDTAPRVKASVPRLVPHQIRRGRVPLTSSSMVHSFANKDLLHTIKTLPIWPLADGSLVALERNVILVRSVDDTMRWSQQQRECLRTLGNEVRLIDEDLFSSADSIMEPSDEGPKKSDTLRSFLLNALSPPHTFSTGVVGGCVGGFLRMAAENVVSTVILPKYRVFLGGDTTVLTRTQAAACIAFLYLCDDASLERKFREVSIVAPVLHATKTPKDVMWSNPQLLALGAESNRSDLEVHVGAEFLDMCTAALSYDPVAAGVICELQWTVLDPMVSAIVFDRVTLLETSSGAAASVVAEVTVSAKNIAGLLHGIPLSQLQHWLRFLFSLGMVDLFAVRPALDATLQSHVPGLVRILSKVAERSEPVATTLHQYSEVLTRREAALVEGETDQPPLHHFPIFLPHTESSEVMGLCMVSSTVHYTMRLLVPMVRRELDRHQAAGRWLPAVRAHVLTELSTMRWFPCERKDRSKLQLVSNAFATKPTDEQVYLLASAMDVVTTTDHRDLVGHPLGPHFLYLPRDLVKDAADLRAFRMWFQLQNIGKPDDLSNFSVLTQAKLLHWMASQGSEALYFNVRVITTLFGRLQEVFRLESLSSDEQAARVLTQTLLADDSQPVVWFPNTMVVTGHEDTYCEGRMYPLRQIVMEDRANFFHDGAPVKALNKFYPVDGKVSMVKLLCKAKYCSSCRAVEGRWGVRGQPRSAVMAGPNPCSCVEYPDDFGAYFPTRPGFVAMSASAAQLLHTLEFYHTRLGAADTPKDVKASLAEQVRSILNSISGNVWQTFHISNGLLPYSAAQLQELVKAFATRALLPRYTQRISDVTFVSSQPPAGMQLLAIDDVVVYSTFRSLLSSANDLLLLDAYPGDIGHVTRRIVSAFFTADRLRAVGSVEYDIAAVEAKTRVFLQLPRDVFQKSCATIPNTTFFTPRNMMPLLQFLRIPLLSEKVRNEVECQVKDTNDLGEDSPALRLIELLNVLLPVADAWLARRTALAIQEDKPSDRVLKAFPSLPHLLGQCSTMRRLFQSRVYDCLMLQRKVYLAAGLINADQTVIDPVHLVAVDADDDGDGGGRPARLDIYLGPDVTSIELRDIAVEVIAQAVRTEIAFVTYNQLQDVVDELEVTLNKCAKISSGQLAPCLEYDGLQEYHARSTSTDEDHEVWRLVNPCTFRVDARAPVEEEESARGEEEPSAVAEVEHDAVTAAAPAPTAEEVEEEKRRSESARAGYEKLKADAAERAKALAQPISDAFKDSGPSSALFPPSAAQTPRNAVSMPMPSLERVHTGPPPTGPMEIVEYVRRGKVAHSASVAEAAGPNIIERVQVLGSEINTPSQPLPNPLPLAPALAQPRSVVYWSPTPMPSGATRGRWEAAWSGVQSTPHDVLEITSVAPQALQLLLDQELNSNLAYTSLPATPVGKEATICGAPLVPNLLSGRLGERLVVEMLRATQLGKPVRNGGPACNAVIWINEDHEQGLPYDVSLTFADGSRILCEVKTRSHTPEQHAALDLKTLQWPVSAAEIRQANCHDQQFFCALVCLQIDYALGHVDVRKMALLGLDTGLMACLRSDAAKLFLQLL